MARIPADPVQPTEGEPVPPVNFNGPAYVDGAVGAHVELSSEQLQAAAGTLGLDFQAMNDEEREFVAMFARGALDSVAPAVEGDVTTDPIVLPDGTTVDPPASPPPPDPANPAATQEIGADGAGVGSASDEPGDGSGEQPSSAAVAPVTSPETVGTPGAPAFDIPSPLPPAPPASPLAPETPSPGQQPEPLVMLANGQMVPLAYAQALVAQQQQQGVPPFAAPQPAPTVPQPQQQYPTPFGTEYVDERAGAEITQLRSTLEQMQMQQQAESERQRAMYVQSLDQAIAETAVGYGSARGLTREETETLLNTATQLGALGMYSQLYPGDPRRAVGAALEMVYWITPEMRQRDIDQTLERSRSELAAIEKQKALAGQTTSTPGSVPRTPAPARNRAEADQGIVAMIEADLARQNGGAGPR